MPSIINSDSGATSGSAGLKFTSADDGVLQIQNNGNTAISISSSGIATFAQPPLTAVPAFRASMSASQSVTNSIVTKVNLDTIDFDTNDWFDTVNYRYTPQIAGYYQVTGEIRTSGTSQVLEGLYLRLNGSADNTNSVIHRMSSSSVMQIQVSGLVYLNGSTDYAELYGQIGASSGNSIALGFFQGFLVRAT